MGGVAAPLPTPTNVTSVIADNSTNNVTTYTATFDANVSAGKRVVIVLQSSALSGSVTVTGADSAGNTWNLIKSYAVNTRRQAVYECVLTNALVSGVTTIPLASSSTGRIHIVGLTADNVATVDTTHAGTAGTADTFSTSTGSLAAAPAVAISVVWKANQNALTEDAGNGWTKLVEDTATGASTMSLSTQVVASTAGLTHAPSWTGSVAYAQFFLYLPGG